MGDMDDKTRRSPLPRGDEIPRRGYEGRRDSDATGSFRPVTPPSSSPPVYESPPRSTGPLPGKPMPPVRRGKRVPRDSGLYLPCWSLVVLVLVVGAAAVGLLVFALNLGSAALLDQTPQVIIVTSAIQPTLPGFDALPTGIPQAQSTQDDSLPTVEPTRTSLPGGCLLNQRVVVFGTGNVGLNLRSEPRRSAEAQFVAPEGDVLQVVDGPQFFDDIEWCKVESISRPGQFGWASLEFLIAEDAVPQDED
ncbi:MAG: SH3 domain-containing protein [Anaerolineae bacterium]|nr:SH3 domain-containing protein [Anaerolineae bacterium]